MITRKQRRQQGFTLIELLVVIIVLGILAGIVVFAVQGAGDKGKGSAEATDARIIRTAQEAFCAKENRYADGQELVDERYLSGLPTYHTVTATPDGGACNGWSYNLEPTGATTTAPSTTSTTAVVDPGNRWEEAAEPFEEYSLRELLLEQAGEHSGKVLSVRWGFEASTPDAGAQLYDPAGTSPSGKPGNWTERPYPPCSPGVSTFACGPHQLNAAVMLRGTADICGMNCGKVLIHFSPPFGIQTPPRWALYDPVTLLTTDVPPAPFPSDYWHSTTLLWASTCEAAGPPAWCGKVVSAGGHTTQFPVEQPSHPQASQLYDPKMNAWVIAGALRQPRAGHLSTPLGDGRVLVVGGFGSEGTAEIFDPSAGSAGDWRLTQNAPVSSGHGFVLRKAKGAVLLSDGRVLIAGGLNYSPSTDQAEIFNPGDETFSLVPGCGCQMVSLTLLPDGKVLVIHREEFNAAHPARIYNPDPAAAADPWSLAGSSALGLGGTLITGTEASCGQNCGKVLVVSDVDLPARRAQLYVPPRG